MQSREPTQQLFQQIEQVIGQQVLYLRKLIDRMDEVGFHEEDPLRLRALAAYTVSRTLWVDIHHRSDG